MTQLAPLGEFMLETARGDQKVRVMPEDVAREVRLQLSERAAPKIEDIRSQERKAFEDSKNITIF